MRDMQEAHEYVPRARSPLTFPPRSCPKTPEPVSDDNCATALPPPPPRYRIKVNRQADAGTKPSYRFRNARVPSIELPDAPNRFEPALPPIKSDINEQHEGYLSPFSPSFSQPSGITPPRTPVSQIYTDYPMSSIQFTTSRAQPLHNDPESDLIRGLAYGISRPASSCSQFSDSSVSSRSTATTGCTSPETEADPFMFSGTKPSNGLLASPMQPVSRSKKRSRVQTQPKWTAEMDEHLWITYTAYLSDPRVTPFKMLPGTAPPLGVCCRVARAARRTWRGPSQGLRSILEDVPTNQASKPTIRRQASAPFVLSVEVDGAAVVPPSDGPARSRSSVDFTRNSLVQWPRSSASTRRRLRELCKRKPSLPPHYQRLMQSRSPSPFGSSSSRPRSRSNRLSSPLGRSEYSAFSTRDLNFTLTTSTAVSMQPDGPLSQLAAGEVTPRQNSQMNVDNPTPRVNAHQKSQSLQLGLGLERRRANEFSRLASPFQEYSEPQNWHSLPRPQTSRGAQVDDATIRAGPSHERGSRPSLEIHHPRPLSGSMKRRAQYQLGDEMFSDDADTRRDFLENLFRDTNPNGRRRVRSRGFSLGAVSQGPPSRPLADLFTPPATQEMQPESLSQTMPSSGDAERAVLSPVQEEGIRRLGSPFAPGPAGTSFANTFPRTLFTQGLDSIASMEPALPQEQFHDLFSPNNVYRPSDR